MRTSSPSGHTCTDNGGPACSRHNWLTQAGYITTRNADGTWTIRRPDGTIIGWRNNQTAVGN
jgi:hypothetical protein